jgi:RHS repeat-associated protein
MGRQVAEVKQAFRSGEWIYQYSRYDSYGRVVEQSVPSHSVNPAHWSRTQYDVFGRVQTITAADETLSRIDYNGLSMTTSVTFNTVNQGYTTQETTEVKDVFGQTVSVTDNLQGETQYFYDYTGNLTKVIGVDGVTIVTQYDKLGRKVRMRDPNKGVWNYTYNALGELTSQTSEVGHTTTFFRDAVGRTVKRHVSGLSVNETTRYDYVQHQLEVECLTSANNCDHATLKKSYEYDSLGRMHVLKTTLDGNEYTQLSTYDSVGRVFQQFDGARPGSLRGIHFHYNAQGYAYKQVEARNSGSNNATVYQEIIDIDAFGNIREYKQNNGKITTRKEYDNVTGYARGVRVNNGQDIQVNRYNFDAIGNLRSRSRESLHGYAHKTESFKYDSMNRLTHINNIERVKYYGNGNIKWKSDANNGNASYYCYRSARPHAVSGLGSQGCTTNSYLYDGNGNMTSGKGRTIRYSHFDKPSYISNAQGTTAFAYDTSRNRYKRETTENNVTTKTYYVGNVEHVYKNGVYQEVRRYLPDAIQTEYIATGAVHTRYLHKDHLGSINTITNEQGKIVEKLYFDAWGKKQSIPKANWLHAVQNQAAPSLINVLNLTPRGFTGHEHIDHADIIHMNGRIYDPTLGRFLQADPHIQAPKNSQSYNRYSYVLNNPLSYTDPSGYFFKSLFKKLNKALGKLAPFASLLAMVFIPGAWAFATESFFGAVTTGFLSGGVATGSVKGALTGAFSAAAFYGIGQHFKGLAANNPADAVTHSFGGLDLTSGQIAGQIASHAAVGGVASVLNGGKFGHGFFAAGVTKGLGGAFLPAGDNLTNGQIFKGAVISAVIGGTSSRISGGKFANGASTGAFQFLFNQAMSRKMRNPQSGELEEVPNSMEPMRDSEGRIMISEHTGEMILITTADNAIRKFYGDQMANALQCQAQQACVDGSWIPSGTTEAAKPRIPGSSGVSRIKISGNSWFILSSNPVTIGTATLNYMGTQFSCSTNPEVVMACGGN